MSPESVKSVRLRPWLWLPAGLIGCIALGGWRIALDFNRWHYDVFADINSESFGGGISTLVLWLVSGPLEGFGLGCLIGFLLDKRRQKVELSKPAVTQDDSCESA